MLIWWGCYGIGIRNSAKKRRLQNYHLAENLLDLKEHIKRSRSGTIPRDITLELKNQAGRGLQVLGSHGVRNY